MQGVRRGTRTLERGASGEQHQEQREQAHRDRQVCGAVALTLAARATVERDARVYIWGVCTAHSQIDVRTRRDKKI